MDTKKVHLTTPEDVSLNFWKKTNVSKKLVFIKVFLWPSSLEIWQHCRKYFAEIRNIFAQCPKMIEKILIFFFWKKLFSWNCVYGLTQKNVGNLPIFFCASIEKDKKSVVFSKKKYSFQQFFLRARRELFPLPSANLSREVRKKISDC